MASNYRRKTDALPTCMNCGSVLYGDFCSSCGQEGTDRITFRGAARQGRRLLLGLDFRLRHTVVALTVDPGRWIRRYLRGARLPFVSPVPYALLAVGVLIAVVGLAQVDLSGPYTPWASETGEEPALIYFMLSVLGVFPVLLPVSWLQRSLFRDAKYNLAETYVFGLYLYGHLAYYQALFALVGGYASLIGLISVILVVMIVLTYALSGFYRRRLWVTLPAALILGTSFMAGIVVFGSLLRLVVQ